MKGKKKTGNVGKGMSREDFLKSTAAGAALAAAGAGSAHAAQTVAPDAVVEAASKSYSLTDEEKKEMLRRMMLIRAFEDKIIELYMATAFGLANQFHLCRGQEATHVGANFAVNSDDYMFSTHRNYGDTIAKIPTIQYSNVDGDPNINSIMAEFFGKSTGCNSGLAGPMHLGIPEYGIMGSNSIVAAGAPLAVGTALASKTPWGSFDGKITLCMVGEGAINQGLWHEAMNFSGEWGLPLIVGIVDNQYSQFTDSDATTSIKNELIFKRGKAYDFRILYRVDGQDVLEVYNTFRQAAEGIRNGSGPALIECETYRFEGHVTLEDYMNLVYPALDDAMADYRTQAEVDEWKNNKDPIQLFKEKLINQGVIVQQDYDDMQTQVVTVVGKSALFAFGSPDPDPFSLHGKVFTNEPSEVTNGYNEPIGYSTSAADWISEPPGWMNSYNGYPITGNLAVSLTLVQEMLANPMTYYIGEDSAIWPASGGAAYFEYPPGSGNYPLLNKFIGAPISESTIVSSSVGAAILGYRPICEIEFPDFTGVCFDSIANQVAKMRFVSGGEYEVPMVIRCPNGGGGAQFAARHSQTWDALFTGIPGLKIVCPSTPYDTKGLLTSAIRSNNPVMCFENVVVQWLTFKQVNDFLVYPELGIDPQNPPELPNPLYYLYTSLEDLADRFNRLPYPNVDYVIPLGKADVKRKADKNNPMAQARVTIIALGGQVYHALLAATILYLNGVEATVIDPRSIAPLDIDKILAELKDDAMEVNGNTVANLIVAEEGHLTHGFGSEIVTKISEALRTEYPPVFLNFRRVAAEDIPIPYNSNLERYTLPNFGKIIDAVTDLLTPPSP